MVNLFIDRVSSLVLLESSVNCGSVVAVRAIADIICRVRAKQKRGFRITIFDERTRRDNSKPKLERVVVAGE